jgi:hypothetical protein
MRRALKQALASVALPLVAACGGNAPPPKHADAPAIVDPSIGDTAVANGGIEGLGGPSGATYAAGGLRADLMDKNNPVKLDGVVDEWPARTLASTVIKGSGDGLQFAVAIQYDASSLYIGAEVTDASFYRTSHFAEGEDHASFTLSFPQGGSVYEIGLFAGKPGETAGEVRFLGSRARQGEVPGAKIVEAPSGKGYSFEASIPWSTFHEAHTLRVGLRGVARYYDSDGSHSARNIVATGPGDASSVATLPALLTEPEESMLEGLLTQNALTKTTPKVDLYADVAGDSMKERISVYDHYVTICGPGYRGGKEFFYRDLGAELVRLEARELTGRGKADLVVRRRFDSEDKKAKREWFEVWSLLGGDEPVTTFAHEIVVARDSKHVANVVHAAGKDIEVTYEPATGWDATSYQEPVANDVEPILLPWGTVRSQTFHFDGTRYKKSREVAQAGVAPTRMPGQPAGPALPVDVPTPVARAGGDLSRQVLEQYRRDQHVGPDVKPRFDLQVDVDGDGKPERVALLGRDLVVFGPGFLGGTRYAFLTLAQFSDGSDIHDVVARDVTGDGSADLVVRGARHVTNGGATVEADGMFVYQVKAGSIARIFAIETAREQGARRVQGMVQLIPNKDGHGFDIDARPGRATGWTQRTFPWAQEQPGAGPIEPLLLPWGGIPSVRYSWNGSAFAKQ